MGFGFILAGGETRGYGGRGAPALALAGLLWLLGAASLALSATAQDITIRGRSC